MGEPRMANANWKCPDNWSEWSQWLAAGLHARNRWRLPVLLLGILFANGRRTVTRWLRAVGVSDDFCDYYYFLASVGHKRSQVVVVGRLRKDAALRDIPAKTKRGQRRPRGRPRKYGKNRISLAKRAGQKRGWQTATCSLYNETATKTYKTFLATYLPVGGVIRVVLIKEDQRSCKTNFQP
jgi:hypothetical protein